MLPMQTHLEAKESKAGCQSMPQMQEPILGQAKSEKEQVATRELGKTIRDEIAEKSVSGKRAP